jgi:hypothetical protein
MYLTLFSHLNIAITTTICKKILMFSKIIYSSYFLLIRWVAHTVYGLTSDWMTGV